MPHFIGLIKVCYQEKCMLQRLIPEILGDHNSMTSAVEYADSHPSKTFMQDVRTVSRRVHQSAVSKAQRLGKREIFASGQVPDSFLACPFTKGFTLRRMMGKIATDKHIS